MGDQKDFFEESSRILRSGGIALNIFPTKYGIIESHTFVPFGAVIQNNFWLRLWGGIGRKASHQANMKSRVIASNNAWYLKNRTNYLSRNYYLKRLGPIVGTTFFAEREWLKISAQKAHIALFAKLAQRVQFLAWIFGYFYMNVLISINDNTEKDRN